MTSPTMSEKPDLSRLRIQREPTATTPRRGRSSHVAGWALLVVVVAGASWAVWHFARGGISFGGSAFRTALVVRVNPVASAEVTSSNGHVVARTRCSVASSIQGRLVKLHVDSGDKVEQGQVLAEIEHSEMDAALARVQGEYQRTLRVVEVEVMARTQAQNTLAASRAAAEAAAAASREATVALADAERRLKREDELRQQRISSEETYDLAQTARDLARARVETAQARERNANADVTKLDFEIVWQDKRIESARAAMPPAEALVRQTQAALDLAFVRAPFSGVVLRKDAEVGEVVSPAAFGGSGSRTAIVTMADFGTLEFEVNLFERDIRLVEPGMPCRISLDLDPGKPLRGRVRHIEPTADRRDATVNIKIEFLDKHPRMVPENSGRAVFLRAGADDAAREPERILVPSAAVIDRDGNRGVFVVESGAARFVHVSTGETEGDKVRATAGLRGGERVILAPSSDVADGTKVDGAK